MSATAAFDILAKTYDADFTGSITGRMQRDLIWKILAKDIAYGEGLDILEINCGTGEDANWLASKGHKVTATDISPEMISVARSKTSSSNLSFSICSFHDLAKSFAGRKFDLIFSNFGGLNCITEGELTDLNYDFQNLLKQGGRICIVLMAKYCWIEKANFMMKADFVGVARRMKPAKVSLGEGVVQNTFYYSSKEISKLFSNFKVTSKKSVGFFSHPLTERIFIKAPVLQKPIALIEKMASKVSFLADTGDHVYITMIKREM